MSLLSQYAVQIGGVLALILAVFGYGASKQRKGRKAGIAKVKRDATVAANKRKGVRDEIDNDVRDIDAADELHDKWTRD